MAPRRLFGRFLKRWPLFLAFAFCFYSAALFTYSVVVHRQMQEEASRLLVADSKRRAAALGDLVEGLSDNAQAYGDLNEIRDYLVNRDLGMSLRYGLSSSLEMIKGRFLERAGQDGERWGTGLPRIAYFAEDGALLADTDPQTGPLTLPDNPRARRTVSVDPARGLLLIVTPVSFRGRPEGKVAIAAPIRVLYRNLLGPQISPGYRELLMTADGERLPGQESLSATATSAIARIAENAAVPLPDAAGPDASGLLALKTSVPRLPMDLVTLVSTDRAQGNVVSVALLFIAGAVPLLLLFAAARLDRLRQRTEQMQAAMSKSEQERFRAEIRNGELADEIARREVIELALVDGEQRWQLAVAGTNDGIWDWNPKTGETFFSERWKSMLGYDDDELSNDVNEWQSRIHPDDLQRTLSEVQRHLRGESEFYQCEHRLRCRDGGYKWILARGRALFDTAGIATRISGSHTDMTQRKHAEALLQERTEQLDAIFALSPDGFVSFDGERRVKYANPAFSGLTGIDLAQIAGRNEHEFTQALARHCHADGFPGGLQRLRESAASDTPGQRVLIELSPGGGRCLEVGLRSSDASSVSQILYFRDVTHETEIDRLKSEFLSTAAHELRTPMASIYGFAEVLLAGDNDAESQQEFLGIIFKQAELMSSILNELLDLARIEARRGKDFVFRKVDAQALVKEVISGFKLPPGRSAPMLAIPEDPLYIVADDKKARQAILNVLSNAYKYSPAGSAVSIAIDATQAGATPPMAAIHIVDHGIGMTPAQLARVCERFYRADSSGKVSGTGLGMSIVKEILDLHGGNLVIESRIGQGTTATLRFPASV